MKRIAAFACLAVLVSGCTSSGDPQPASPDAGSASAVDERVREVEVVGATLTYPDGDSTGVASRIEEIPLEGDDVFDLFDGNPTTVERAIPLAFALRSCTDEGGGRLMHEVQWRGPPEFEYPVTVTLWVGPLDGAFYGQGGLFEVDLEADGVFPLAVDLRETADDGDNGVSVGAEPTAQRYCEMRVLSEDYVDDQTEPGLVYEPAEVAPSVAAPDGSLQSYAIDEVAAGPLLRELLLEVGTDSDLLPARWWLSLDAEPETFSIRRDDTCWLIESRWKAPAVETRQDRGCEPALWPSTFDVIQIDDPSWNVVVAGEPDDVSAYLASVVSVPVAGVDPVGSGNADFDALATFESQLAESGIEPFGRIPWGQDGVIIVWSSDGDLSGEIEATGFTPDQLNAGGGGTPIQPGVCAATLAYGDATAGFAVIVYEDAAIDRVEVQRPSGDWEPVEIIANGPYRLGLLDSSLAQEGRVGVSAPPIRGFDATGAPIDCVRSN